ncbi:hypothetical protein [Clostridioides difficile]|uniref:hypothetical protein n=1 Tax=Clostridioides difficile TaxID=1496 RepID=UPI0009800C59|nr:hypothetical protein [Clostridioides difficile]SJP26944.1 Uncharacterised protein [Clostridioides difficile]
MDIKNVSSNIVVNNYLKNTSGIKKVEEVKKINKTDKIELICKGNGKCVKYE